MTGFAPITFDSLAAAAEPPRAQGTLDEGADRLARLRGNPQCVGWTLTEVRHTVVSEQIPPDHGAGQSQ